MRFATRTRVLVVDDEPSICKALSIALEDAGYAAEYALSGEAALGVVRARAVDVLLIDLRIPDTRGDIVYELAAAIQPQLRTQTLFMTGDITEKGHSLIAACRCNFLRKPFHLDDMLAAVAALSPRVRDASA